MLANVFFFAQLIMLFAFGWMLLSAIRNIRKYLKEHSEDNVNTRVLVLHSLAFGLFMAGLPPVAIAHVADYSC